MQDEVPYEVGPHSSAIEPILLAVMRGLALLLMMRIFCLFGIWDLGQIAQQS